MNPLLTIGQYTPFDTIKPEHARPAIEQITKESEQAIDLLIQANDISWVSVENLEGINDRLDKAEQAIGHLFNVMGNADWRNAYEASLPIVTSYKTKISQHEGLFNLFNALKNSEAFATMNTEQQKVINDRLRNYELSGVSLPAEKKTEFQAVMQTLSQINAKFGNNVTDAGQSYHLPITEKVDLQGVPDTAIALYKQLAEDSGKQGWLVSLDLPLFLPFMTNAHNRKLRETLYHAYVTRASDIGPDAGKFDNTTLIKDTMRARKALIDLLGFETYADYSLARKMAEKPSDVTDFLRDLAKRAKPIAQERMHELEAHARSEYGIEKLEPWDTAFISEKVREKRFAFSQDEVQQYFPMEKVVEGLFDICTKLFGITFRTKNDMPTWHDVVQTYAVINENGEEIAAFYLDLYARHNKRGGAWVDNCIERRITSDLHQNPVAFVTCNFTPPTENETAYFAQDEVRVLFHEFGHALHLMLSQVEYKGLNSFNVEWDSVELPSQFMENYCYQYEVLKNMSQHKITGECLPIELFDKLIQSKNFLTSFHVLTLVDRALFDMTLHMEKFDETTFDVLKTFKSVHNEVVLQKTPEYNRYPMGFLHIFAGGYEAGYYSYHWAEVLSAEAFSRFEEEGIFSRELGEKYKQEILSVGASRPAMDNFVAFRGRKPTIDAFLRHNGLSE